MLFNQVDSVTTSSPMKDGLVHAINTRDLPDQMVSGSSETSPGSSRTTKIVLGAESG